ncbi:hypothetical protein Tco_1046860 [Tanacetum coccineum]
MYYPRFTKLVVNYVMEKDPSIPRRNKVNWHYARDDPMFSTINVISRNEATQLNAMASGTIPPKTKGSKKKANTDAIPKRKSSTAPKKKKSGTGKQMTSELENISEAELTEAEQLKVVLKRSRLETHSSHASGSGADEGTGITPGVPDAPDYDSDDDISWKSSDEDQDDDDAEKHEVHETTQEEDDVMTEDADGLKEMTESDNDGDDFVHPKLTTHEDEIIHEKDTDEDDSSISSSDEDDSDNDVEGAKVAGAKSGEDATDAKDQGNEAVKDSNTDLDGRDKVMTDVEDTHVTLTPVNPDGQQQSSSVSSGFVINYVTQIKYGVDDIFRQLLKPLSLIDTIEGRGGGGEWWEEVGDMGGIWGGSASARLAVICSGMRVVLSGRGGRVGEFRGMEVVSWSVANGVRSGCRRASGNIILFSIVTSMCCDDAYSVTPCVSALAGCDRLDSEEESEPKKKRLKEASESDSNTLPPDNIEPNEETETDLDSISRCEAKPNELENTCESSVRSKSDSPQTIPAYMLPDYPFHRSFF